MIHISRNIAPAAWDLSHQFTFNGNEIRYGVTGAGDPLALLHGTPFSSIVWRRIAPWLAERRRVYYFDLLGYGRSAKPDADVSLRIQNELFAALLDHWQLARPDVVAHDFGGTTALRAHLINGREYRSLTLIDPVAIGPSESAFYRQIAQMGDGFTDEIEERFAEIRCPVTILWGEEDAWIPLERGRELARRIPKADFRSISNCKHLVQEDAPEASIATVLDFLLRAPR